MAYEQPTSEQIEQARRSSLAKSTIEYCTYYSEVKTGEGIRR